MQFTGVSTRRLRIFETFYMTIDRAISAGSEEKIDGRETTKCNSVIAYLLKVNIQLSKAPNHKNIARRRALIKLTFL